MNSRRMKSGVATELHGWARKTALAAALLGLVCLVMQAPAAQAKSDNPLQAMQQKITDFTLDNGMQFIIVERHDAPVASFFIHVDAGSVNEHWGITGMAHMFEHMAFKGTETIGTTDFAAEQRALDAVDAAFDAWRAERTRPNADPAKVAKLEEAFKAAQVDAGSFVVQNEYMEIYNKAGESGLNAFTSYDLTGYVISLPSNKTELWFAMESERFLHPVLREFFKERDVVKEERRMRVDNRPDGRLFEDILATAFRAHPYGSPTIGYYSDLDSFTRDEAKEFFNTYYTASNMVVAIVGDVNPADARRWAEEYFGRLPKRPKPGPVESREVEPLGEHRIVHVTPSQPVIAMAWLGTSFSDPDNTAMEVLSQVLSRGRTSRIYRTLVEEKKLALAAGAFTGLPGDKYPGLFLIYAVNNVNVDTATLEAEIDAIILDIQENGITQEELDRIKTSSYAGFVRGLQSSMGLAQQLTTYQIQTGSWKNLFSALDDINAVTVQDVQAAATKYLKKQRRVVGIMETEKK